MVKVILSLQAMVLLLFSAGAQNIGIGEWRDHLPYNKGISVASDGNNVYCATAYSIFYFSKSDNSLNRFTKINGLNDIGIVKIGYNTGYHSLVVLYSSTNIDLVKDNSIINMPDIYNSNAITPEEKILNNLMFIDNLAYISSGFGIVVLDIEKEEIAETYYIGPDGTHLKVYDLTVNDTSFFAATETGIYYARRNNPNLAYYGSWSKLANLPFPDAEYNLVETFSNKLFINKYTPDIYAQDTTMYFDGTSWHKNIPGFTADDMMEMKVFNDQLYLVQRNNVRYYDASLSLIENIGSYGSVSSNPREMIIDDGLIWIADDKTGLVRRNDIYDYSIMYPNGPMEADVFDMSVEGGYLWTVPGGRNLSWGDIWKWGTASYFTGNEWSTIDRFSEGAQALDSVRDNVVIAVNPYNPAQVFAGSWYTGLLEFNNFKFQNIYFPENSSLEYNLVSGPPEVKIGGLAYDGSGNLWMTNSGAINILSVRMNDGSANGNWMSFYCGSFSSGEDIGQMIIDAYGQKWILWREKFSLIVFSDNGTITDQSDDQYKKLTSAEGNGAIPANNVISIASDLDGEVWIGTDEGVAVFYSPENVFSGYNFDAQRILIPRNDGTGLADILLEGESVTAIEIDGANNKWIGTDGSGVYQLSPDGIQELNHFTTANSPLFSNSITSIDIDHKTGEVYIGTLRGIISYKSTATQGGETNSDVYAYPNPVMPGYNGPIAITGLVTNADFKITDISGTLIYSGTAEGGQAIWDGNNFDGRRAQSGVYLVFISNEDGTEKFVTKILFMN